MTNHDRPCSLERCVLHARLIERARAIHQDPPHKHDEGYSTGGTARCIRHVAKMIRMAMQP